jgi:glycerol-3-phosphate dehydrogenase
VTEVEAVVVGGGATGSGLLRDLAMRGVRSLLIERADFGSGTSGRYHGLLHSGGRYVVRDPVSARDCAHENAILRRIAPGCLELTGGYFVATPDDPDDYLAGFPAACAAAGVPIEEVSLARLFEAEPLLSRGIRAAYAVEDAALEPWELIDANLASAREHGADAWRYHQLVEVLRGNDGAIRGVTVEDQRTGERREIACRVLVNAAGAWAGAVAALGGGVLHMSPGKGSMLIMNRRITSAVINRLAPPGDGDIIVPVHTVSILGTTDIHVDDPDDAQVTRDEVTALLADGDRLVPGLSGARVLRSYAGCRPLYDASELASGGTQELHHEDSREISRAHHVIDHGAKDGVPGLWSIVGGKLTTFRLMAEQAADRVCRSIGVDAPCRTAIEPLPGRASGDTYWVGSRLAAVESGGGGDAELVCECELVTNELLHAAVEERADSSLDDLRRTTRLGMGPCQGAFCTCRAAAYLADRYDAGLLPPQAPEPNDSLRGFLQERLRGARPIAWEDQLMELWLEAGVYRGTMAIDTLPAADGGAPSDARG